MELAAKPQHGNAQERSANSHAAVQNHTQVHGGEALGGASADRIGVAPGGKVPCAARTLR